MDSGAVVLPSVFSAGEHEGAGLQDKGDEDDVGWTDD
jgi:hypothetical protein